METEPEYTLARLFVDIDSVVLRVRAAPGASRECVTGLHGDALKIAVTAPPEKGKANARIVAVLAETLGLSKAQVSLEKGAASRDKSFRLQGITAAEVLERLAQLDVLKRKSS